MHWGKNRASSSLWDVKWSMEPWYECRKFDDHSMEFDGYFNQSEMNPGTDNQWEGEFDVSLWKSAWEELPTERWLPWRR